MADNFAASTSTNDHIVPRMYLRRFAIEKPGGPQVRAAKAETLESDFIVNTRNVGAEKSFYWGTGPQGLPTHDMETFLTAIESAAAPAFRRILDKGKRPSDNAYPDRWPPSAETRTDIAWWLAAQLIRTAPQRDRLWRIHGDNPLEAPRSLRRADLHHAYIVQAVAPLAALIHARPWGFGFTNLCLLTSDSPVQVFNAHDDDEPLDTAAFWDIYVPLDPHRFIYLPGRMHATQPSLMRDHFINLPGGLAIGLNHEIVKTAHRHVIWQPEHDPRHRSMLEDAPAARATHKEHGSQGTVMQYTALEGGFGVERRWLSNHTWDAGLAVEKTVDSRGPMSDQEAVAVAVAERMLADLEQASSEFDEMRGH